MSTDDLERMRERMRKLSGRSGRVSRPSIADTSLAAVQAKKSRSASARRSKTKGSSYERRIAKLFGAWSGDTLRRTPQSGGWHGSTAHGVSGDLVCDKKRFPFHIECKKREGWTLEDLIVGVRSGLTDPRSVLAWWQQTLRTCPSNKIPTLIFSRNHIPDLIMLKRVDFDKLCAKRFTVDFLPHYIFALDSGEVVILSLKDFFTKVPPPKGCSGRKAWRVKHTL